MKKKINEILFVIYIFLFVIIRPINYFIPGYSRIIMIFGAFLIVTGIFFNNYKMKRDSSIIKPLFFIFFFFSLFLIDLSIRPNRFSLEDTYDFLIFGILSTVAISNITDIKLTLFYYYKTSVVLVFLFILDPFYDYAFSGGYMDFGYLCILPIFFGLHIGVKIFKDKKIIPLQIVCFIVMFIFANRGATLTALVFIILIDILNSKMTVKKTLIYSAFSLAISITVSQAHRILKVAMAMLNQYNIYSYSLRSLYNSIVRSQSIEKLFSGRIDIWKNYIDMLSISPIFGHGVGSFEDKYNIYSHNLFVDISIFWGLPILCLTIILILNSLYKMFKSPVHSEKVLGIIIFFSWFPMLILSRQITSNYGIWMFINFGLLKFPKLEDEHIKLRNIY